MTTVMEKTSTGSDDGRLFDLPVDRNILFSDADGRLRPGIEKRQTKLAGKLAFLMPFLKDGEKILLVTTGCSPMSLLEQAVTGWLVYSLKRSVFVFTDRGLFHIPAKADFSYRSSIARIDYSACSAMSMKRNVLDVRYQNGAREKFTYIDRRERKKIKALLAGISLEAAQSKAGGRTHLCPRCTKELVKDEYTCPGCRLVFKNLSDARRISILYPGGGYFYSGHPILGIGDAITELILMAMVVASLIDALQGDGNGFGLPAIWGIALILEKSISVYHSNHFIREFIPEEKVVRALGGMK